MDEPRPAITADLVVSRYEALMKRRLRSEVRHALEQAGIIEPAKARELTIRLPVRFTVQEQPE